VLINQFPSKKAALGPHADDEKSIVVDSIVASISLGATRTARLSDKETGRHLRTLILRSGSLYSMELQTQKILLHEILPGEKDEGTRYSLTFRHMRMPNKRKGAQNLRHSPKKIKNKDQPDAGSAGSGVGA
jgi:hypothetical protein